MPIYEYLCAKCQQVEELIQKFDEDSPMRCSHCGANGTMAKVVSNSAFHLKGGGWYKDLYASTKPGQESSTEPAKIAKD